MIPLATTTVSILRTPVADLYAEPQYDGNANPRRTVVASGIRAHINAPSGSESQAQGEQLVSTSRLTCDIGSFEINHLDGIKDERTGIVYEVQYAAFYPAFIPHWEAQLVRTEGRV